MTTQLQEETPTEIESPTGANGEKSNEEGHQFDRSVKRAGKRKSHSKNRITCEKINSIIFKAILFFQGFIKKKDKY